MKTVSSQWREQRIVIPGRTTFLPYYTTSAWGKNEEYFFFFSATPGFERLFLHTYDPVKAEIRSELALESWFDRPFESAFEEMLSSLPLAAEEKIIIPRGNELFRLSPITGETEHIFTYPESTVRLGGPAGLSPDGKLCAFVTYSKPIHSRLLIFDQKAKALLREIDFGSFHANHFQFQSDTDYLTFAHEGPTETIPDRINRINWKTGERKVLHPHLTGDGGEVLEFIGHEITRGKTIAAVRYPVSKLPGALVTMEEDGSNYTVLDCDDYWHSSANTDGTVFAMDTMWWGNTSRKQEQVMDIIRIDRTAGTKEIVKTIHSDPRFQFRHPHPQLNAKGDKLLFHEDFDRETGAITLLML